MPICNDCNKSQPKKNFRKIQEYLTHVCKTCSYQRTKIWEANNLVKRMASQKKPSNLFSKLKYSAKKRGHIITLTLEEYCLLFEQSCFYCSGYFDTSNGYGYRIDRLNNDEGYTLKNSVCCCYHCNKLKNDSHTSKETKIMIDALIEYRKNIKI